jgi:hypothetical protein
MSKKLQEQRILNWLESEKKKDKRELELQKNLLAQQMKKFSKEDLFPKPKKLTLWQRLKILILGT